MFNRECASCDIIEEPSETVSISVTIRYDYDTGFVFVYSISALTKSDYEAGSGNLNDETTGQRRPLDVLGSNVQRLSLGRNARAVA